MGSGSLAAMSVFESKYKEGLTVSLSFLFVALKKSIAHAFISIEGMPILQRDEGVNLVAEAICSGIFNDLGSGSNVDICVITKVCFVFLISV